MQLRTEITLQTSANPVSHASTLLLIGSCFTEHIGQLLQEFKFRAVLNPSGILYNPLSMAQTLQMLLQKQVFTQNDLFFHNEQWHSFAHHGHFSGANATGCLENINAQLARGSVALQKADYVILTFGTAFVYRLKSSGQVVANCHKLPDAFFTRTRISPSEVIGAMEPVLTQLWQFNPQARVILTISPIRHWKDGAVNNQLSKATLIMAAHELKQKFEGKIDYFPAYEFMMDDLRDYRFYQPDMLHPSSTAIEYIWQKFADAYFSSETRDLMGKIEKITKACKHKPRNSNSNAYQQFAQQQQQNIKQLLQKYTDLNFEQELQYLRQFIEKPE